MKKILGNTNISISNIVLGCWAMAGDYFGAADDQLSIATIKKSLDLGINTFDNAEFYGQGHAEEVLGRALQGVDRDQYVLITKVWKTNMSRETMPKACEGSMKRMGVDYIDVYFLHYPITEVPIGEIMDTIMRLKEQGKIGAIGVSNFSVEQIEQALRYGTIDVVQPCYSLLWRYIDRDLLPYCRHRGMGVIPYSSLAQGLLTGTLKADTVIDDGRKNSALFQPGIYEECLKVTEFIKKIGEAHGKTPSQVAINWLANTPGITAPIVGGTTPQYMIENFEAVNWTMSADEYHAIDDFSKSITDKMPEFELFFSTTVKS